MDSDLRSIQQARELLREARAAQHLAKKLDQEAVDRIVTAMVRAGASQADRLGRLAHQETGFGKPESKKEKNLFATQTLHERMEGMRTVGIIRKLEGDTIWEVASPMGVVAALIPSTNPTSTAMYKAIIAAKARCAVVMSPHPRARNCTADALSVVAEAAYRAGAPKGLFGCMTEVSLAGTQALLEDPEVDLILATGGTAMVKAAYSKGKPAYGVGSGNVPVYVDRSADVSKAARDLVHGASFDWGTLCSTERSIVCDLPVREALLQGLKAAGAYLVTERERPMLEAAVVVNGALNIEQVGKSPEAIADMAGFKVPRGTRALIAEATKVGAADPLSRETLSPIMTLYTADGWEAGCERCMEILAYGGMGHTLALHAGNERIIEAFALQKPAMRIVVNSVSALGSVGYTNRLFPAMTLGPGTVGGSITSDNISPLHLLNIKRVAFETNPVTSRGRSSEPVSGVKRGKASSSGGAGGKAGAPTNLASPARATKSGPASSWIDEIESRLRDRAGNPVHSTSAAPLSGPAGSKSSAGSKASAATSKGESDAGLSDAEIDALVREFRR
ncbi:MAG: aldehyde dehydrogenase family protein [Rhodothermales bacterium]|nr:aldehyde dehydrogenase family protein [Rhodothermales bacterium]